MHVAGSCTVTLTDAVYHRRPCLPVQGITCAIKEARNTDCGKHHPAMQAGLTSASFQWPPTTTTAAALEAHLSLQRPWQPCNRLLHHQVNCKHNCGVLQVQRQCWLSAHRLQTLDNQGLLCIAGNIQRPGAGPMPGNRQHLVMPPSPAPATTC